MMRHAIPTVLALAALVALFWFTGETTRPRSRDGVAASSIPNSDGVDPTTDVDSLTLFGTVEDRVTVGEVVEDPSSAYVRVLDVWNELGHTYGKNDRALEVEARGTILDENAALFESWRASPEFDGQWDRLFEEEFEREPCPLPDLAAFLVILRGGESYGSLQRFTDFNNRNIAGPNRDSVGIRLPIPYAGELGIAYIKLSGELQLSPDDAARDFWDFVYGDSLSDHGYTSASSGFLRALLRTSYPPRGPDLEYPVHLRDKVALSFTSLGAGHTLALFKEAFANEDLHRGTQAPPKALILAWATLAGLSHYEERAAIEAEETHNRTTMEMASQEIGAVLRKRMFVGLEPDIRKSLYFGTFDIPEGEAILLDILHNDPGDRDGALVEIDLSDRVTALWVLGSQHRLDWDDLIRLSRDPEVRIARGALFAIAGQMQHYGVYVQTIGLSSERQRGHEFATRARDLCLEVAVDDEEDLWKRVIALLFLSQALPIDEHRELYRRQSLQNVGPLAVASAIAYTGRVPWPAPEDVLQLYGEVRDKGARLLLAHRYHALTHSNPSWLAKQDLDRASTSQQVGAAKERIRDLNAKANAFLTSLRGDGFGIFIMEGAAPAIDLRARPLPTSIQELVRGLELLRRDSLELARSPIGDELWKVLDPRND